MRDTYTFICKAEDEYYTGKPKKTILSECFDEMYVASSAKQGVLDIVANGRFLINGMPIPYKLQDGSFSSKIMYMPNGYTKEEPGEKIFWQLENGLWSWMAHRPMWFDVKEEGKPYEEALISFIDGLSQRNGYAIELIKDENGFVSEINMIQKVAAVVFDVEENGCNTILSVKKEVPTDKWIEKFHKFETVWEDATIIIPTTNLENKILPYDLILFWWEYKSNDKEIFAKTAPYVLGKFTGEAKPDERPGDEMLSPAFVGNYFNGTCLPQALIDRSAMTEEYRNFQFMWHHIKGFMGNPVDRTEELVVMWTTEYGFPFGYSYAAKTPRVNELGGDRD